MRSAYERVQYNTCHGTDYNNISTRYKSKNSQKNFSGLAPLPPTNLGDSKTGDGACGSL